MQQMIDTTCLGCHGGMIRVHSASTSFGIVIGEGGQAKFTAAK